MICTFIDLCQNNLLVDEYMVLIKAIRNILKESHEEDLLSLILMYSRSSVAGEKVGSAILEQMYEFCCKFVQNASMKNKPIML